MALEFGAKQLISYDPQQSSEKITDSYISLVRGLMSFPLNFPGTAYYKCMKVTTICFFSNANLTLLLDV
jgi:hypothetical protein